MDPREIAPEGESCGNPHRADDVPYLCMRRVGHDGFHAAEPCPGGTIMWANTAVPPPPPMTGILGPYGIPRTTPEELQQQRTTYNAEMAQEHRRDAVELAVRALTPIVPAFSGDAIGGAIIELAEELGSYIRNGAQA